MELMLATGDPGLARRLEEIVLPRGARVCVVPPLPDPLRDLCGRLKPEVLVLDCRGSIDAACEAVRRIRSVSEDTEIVLFGEYSELRRAVLVVPAGAFEHLPQGAGPERLAAAIRGAAAHRELRMRAAACGGAAEPTDRIPATVDEFGPVTSEAVC